jgi:hypothetical protein
MAFLNRRFDDFALLGDMRLAFGDVSISLGQVLAFTTVIACPSLPLLLVSRRAHSRSSF